MAKAPGKSFRLGISIVEFLKKFPDDATAEAWFVERRWPLGPRCPRCGSPNVQAGCSHKTMHFRCRKKVCGRKRFSVRTGTVMESSKIGYRDWLLAMFLVSTNLKSVSSMKLHRDLGVTRKSAWFLAHRIRAALSVEVAAFEGPVEVDGTYVGGKRKNMSKSKRERLTGTGPKGKAPVVGAKDRATNKVAARAVGAADKPKLQSFVGEHAKAGAKVRAAAANRVLLAICNMDFPPYFNISVWASRRNAGRPD